VASGATMTVTPVDNNVRDGDQTVDITFSVTAALPALDPGYQNPVISPLQVSLEDDERIIFTTQRTRTGDLTSGGSYYDVDNFCASDPGAQPLIYYSLAMLAVDNSGSGLQRIASSQPNVGNEWSWVLIPERNYISDTRNGPVIGRANSRKLLDFPLAHPLTTAGDVWTGLEADWTTAGTNCALWFDGTNANMGRYGAAGSTTTTALAGGTAACDSLHRILCVEQY